MGLQTLAGQRSPVSRDQMSFNWHITNERLKCHYLSIYGLRSMDWLHVSQSLFCNFVPWPYLKTLTTPANTPPFGHPKQGRHFEITCRLCLSYQIKFNISTPLAVLFEGKIMKSSTGVLFGSELMRPFAPSPTCSRPGGPKRLEFSQIARS